jgi:hypothetical protein
MNESLREIYDIQRTIKQGQLFNAVIGVIVLSFGIYALSLSVKVNKLSLQKLKDEGYQ